MRSGDRVLQDLNRSLDVPARVRADVLREVREDLRDLVDRLVAEGVPAAEAEARALRLLEPGPEATAMLVHVHRAPAGRIRDVLGDRADHRVEWVGTVGLAGLAVWAPMPPLLLSGRVPWWAGAPLVALGVLLVANLTREALRWWLRRDAEVARLRWSATVQGAGVVLVLVWGALAVALDAYRTAGAWSVTPPGVSEVAAWLSRALTLQALSLGIAMLGVFGALALGQALVAARRLDTELKELLHGADSNNGRW